jgi:hypothetical protein
MWRNNLASSIQVIDRGPSLLEDRGGSISTLHLGQLMTESGYQSPPPPPDEPFRINDLPWFGSLPEMERRLKALNAQRDEAERRLDAALLS